MANTGDLPKSLHFDVPERLLFGHLRDTPRAPMHTPRTPLATPNNAPQRLLFDAPERLHFGHVRTPIFATHSADTPFTTTHHAPAQLLDPSKAPPHPPSTVKSPMSCTRALYMAQKRPTYTCVEKHFSTPHRIL